MNIDIKKEEPILREVIEPALRPFTERFRAAFEQELNFKQRHAKNEVISEAVRALNDVDGESMQMHFSILFNLSRGLTVDAALNPDFAMETALTILAEGQDLTVERWARTAEEWHLRDRDALVKTPLPKKPEE